MELQKLTDRISYLPAKAELEYPVLGYVRGERFSLAVDAGYSARHLGIFYSELERAGLKKPDFTALTHWHCDHSFGLHAASGLGIAHTLTNAKLKDHVTKSASMPGYREFMMRDSFFSAEYRDAPIVVASADIEFTDELTLDLGGVNARIFHVESPHTFDAVCVFVPEERVLFLGDAIYGDYQNNWVMTEPKLRSLIEMIERTDCDICVASHANPHSKESMLRYLYRKMEKAKAPA